MLYDEERALTGINFIGNTLPQLHTIVMTVYMISDIIVRPLCPFVLGALTQIFRTSPNFQRFLVFTRVKKPQILGKN